MIDMPKRAINLAYRVMQILATRQTLTVHIMVIDGRWYATFEGAGPERLG